MAGRRTQKAKAGTDIPVYSPNRAYNGVTAGIQFVDGNGVIPADHPEAAYLAGWFQERGYTLGAEPEPAAEPEPDAEPAAE